jgi:hypothetical protein
MFILQKRIRVCPLEEAKLVTVIWFSDSHEVQEAVFPAAMLTQAKEKKSPVIADKWAGEKRGRKLYSLLYSLYRFSVAYFGHI